MSQEGINSKDNIIDIYNTLFSEYMSRLCQNPYKISNIVWWLKTVSKMGRDNWKPSFKRVAVCDHSNQQGLSSGNSRNTSCSNTNTSSSTAPNHPKNKRKSKHSQEKSTCFYKTSQRRSLRVLSIMTAYLQQLMLRDDLNAAQKGDQKGLAIFYLLGHNWTKRFWLEELIKQDSRRGHVGRDPIY